MPIATSYQGRIPPGSEPICATGIPSCVKDILRDRCIPNSNVNAGEIMT